MERTGILMEQGTPAQLSRQELRDKIARLAIPSDAKVLLDQLATATVDIGGRVIRAGQRILTFILEAVQMFPKTAFGLVAAFVVSTLIAAIPLLGPMLSPLLTPLILAFGIANGALADLRDGAIHARLRVLENDFTTLIRPA